MYQGQSQSNMELGYDSWVKKSKYKLFLETDKLCLQDKPLLFQTPTFEVLCLETFSLKSQDSFSKFYVLRPSIPGLETCIWKCMFKHKNVLTISRHEP